MSLSSNFSGVIGFTNPITTDDYSKIIYTFGQFAFNLVYDFGSGPNQILKAYADHKSITNTTQEYDLSTLEQSQGMGTIRGIGLMVLSPIGTTGSGTFGPSAVQGWDGIGTEVIMPKYHRFSMWPDVGAPPLVPGVTDSVSVIVSGTLEFVFFVLGY